MHLISDTAAKRCCKTAGGSIRHMGKGLPHPSVNV